MNIHKIDNHLHHSFLEEERKDAITGDLIQANDEVVFCGVCKSAFLKDSWEYMGKKHCNDFKTLDSVPISQPLSLSVFKIIPKFITLINSDISFKECQKFLSTFKPSNKKTVIYLKEDFKKGTVKYNELLDQCKRIESKRIGDEMRENYKPIEIINEHLFNTCAGTLGVSVIFLPITLLKLNEFVKLGWTWGIVLSLVIISVIYFLIHKFLKYASFEQEDKQKNKKDISEQEEISNKVIHKFPPKSMHSSDNHDAVTFGMIDKSLFFYFEEAQQAIFLEFTRIDQIRINYQSDTYWYITLIKHKQKDVEVTIPLVFLNKEELDLFLLELGKMQKELSSKTKMTLIDFPSSIIRNYKEKSFRYKNFLFIQNSTETQTEDYKKSTLRELKSSRVNERKKMRKKQRNKN
ncbi:hypothetical protein ACE193_02820 [Bernardetia sp. OM2101]|uniref:hypothetical protein n=1 Tax=Bernardetia sp. OM2101 TaxID=3344876 RepID=UPI0035D0B06A